MTALKTLNNHAPSKGGTVKYLKNVMPEYGPLKPPIAWDKKRERFYSLLQPELNEPPKREPATAADVVEAIRAAAARYSESTETASILADVDAMAAITEAEAELSP